LSLLLIDAVIVTIVPFIALFLRFEGAVDGKYYHLILGMLPEIVAIRLLTFYFFGLYHRLWRYASIGELLAIIGAVTVSSVLLTIYNYAAGIDLPKSIPILAWLLNILFIGTSRMFIRVCQYIRQQQKERPIRTLIIGAGDAGAMIAREIGQRYYEDKKLVGFIDDDKAKHNQMLFDAKVLGGRHDIGRIVQEQKVNEIIIAMPSAGGSVIREIIQICKKTGCTVKTVPGIYELIDGKVSVQLLRDVDVEDRLDPLILEIMLPKILVL